MGANNSFFSASTLSGSTLPPSGLSYTYATAAFPASRPSVYEPDENLCADPPTPSPAAESPFTAVTRFHPQKNPFGAGASRPLTHKTVAEACEPIGYGSVSS